MTNRITSKLPNTKTTIFTEMSMLAADHNAINLGQGFPDFPMNPELIDLVSGAMKAGHNQYVHMNGLPALREVLAEKINKLYATGIIGNDSITVTPGGTYALYTALTAILQPGDEVIVFEPAYDSYIPAIEMNGATAVPLQLMYPDYRIDWNAAAAAITDRTKGIMINSPHNPTGAVLAQEDLLMLQELVRDKNIFVISDEVYEHLIFDDLVHNSILKYPQLFEKSFVCFSFGKVYHCTGWKMGYCVAPPALMKEFRKIHQFNAFTCFGPLQYALAEFLKKEEHYLSLGKFLQQKRDCFRDLMKGTGFTPLKSRGSYFELYSYEGLSDETEKDFAVRLTKDFGVATIPVSAFYKTPVENKVLRFCFAKTENTLAAAAERLVEIRTNS